VSDEQDAREIVLLTNIFHPASSTVTAICKERWQIELFFKALKQNLKVKTFVGTGPPAGARPPARLQKPCGGQEASGVRAVRRAGENAVKRRFGPP